MKKHNPKIILTFFSMIVGVFIATQIKMKLDIFTPVTLKSIQTTKSEIASVSNEISELNKAIKMKEEELAVLENIQYGDENIINILNEDIKYNKLHSGRVSLNGPGIVIKMYDNPAERLYGFDLNDDIIHDVDILAIINDLRIAGAEAISLNGERVLSTSEVQCTGPTIGINGRRYATPFVIKAIGDPKLLFASVNAPGTYGNLLKIYDIGFETVAEDMVNIPAFNGMFNYKYAKPLGEGD